MSCSRKGQEPKTEWEYVRRPRKRWCYVLPQDFSNMAAVQQGMKSLGFSGTKPNPYMERSIANLHRNLAKYMGTGAPRAARKERRSMTADCGPTDVPQDVDIDGCGRSIASSGRKRLRPEGSGQYLELKGEYADFYEVDPYTASRRVIRSSKTPMSSSSAAGSPDCWRGRT